jgi:flagellar basal-body rod modification protein FlgD
VSRIGETTATSYGGHTYENGGAILGQGDFLRLLIAQLKSQDPLSPMKDQEFAAQMAQFSSLESIQNLSRQFERFVELQTWSVQLGQGAGLIGKTVDLEVDGSVVTGEVSAVRFVDGFMNLVVNGAEYSAGALLEIRA